MKTATWKWSNDQKCKAKTHRSTLIFEPFTQDKPTFFLAKNDLDLKENIIAPSWPEEWLTIKSSPAWNSNNEWLDNSWEKFNITIMLKHGCKSVKLVAFELLTVK